MGNVWDALKKHEADEAAKAVSSPEKDSQSSAVDLKPAPQPAPQETASRPAPQEPVSQKPSPKQAKPKKPARKKRGADVEVNTTGKKYSDLLVTHHDRGGAITEEYRALRTSLLAQYTDGRFCILVTSAEAGEGKSVTSANLALAMTERVEHQTILVDCDLRRGKMAKTFNTRSTPGLSELMQGTASLDDAIQPTAYPNLFFIPKGEVKVSEAGEIIGRPEMVEIVSELRHRYDHVIFDTPPINIVSDAGTIGRVIGDALLVVRMSKTRRESIDKAVRLLHAADVELAGIVLTHRKYYIPNYLYRYS